MSRQTRLTTLAIFFKWFFIVISAQYFPYPYQIPYQVPYQNYPQPFQQNPQVFPQPFQQGFPLVNNFQGFQQNLPVYKDNAQAGLPQSPFLGLPLYPQYPAYPSYPQFPKSPYFPVSKPGIIDIPAGPYNGTLSPNIPVEIIDVDENGNPSTLDENTVQDNEIKPEPTTPSTSDEDSEEEGITTTPEPQKSTIHPLISGTSIQHYSSNINNTKGIQIYESKPVNTVIRRTIHSNGKDGKNVLNIHVVNGIEVTSMDTPSIIVYEEGATERTRTTTEKESEEEEEIEGNDENAVGDPKPVLSWFSN